MKLYKIGLLAICGLGIVATDLGAASAAPATQDERVAVRRRTSDGKYLTVIVRKKRIRNDDYDYNRTPSFEIGGLERPTLRYGNTGFIGQAGYFGNGGFRTQLGASSFDNLR